MPLIQHLEVIVPHEPARGVMAGMSHVAGSRQYACVHFIVGHSKVQLKIGWEFSSGQVGGQEVLQMDVVDPPDRMEIDLGVHVVAGQE